MTTPHNTAQPCTCVSTCGDTPEETGGTCKSLPRPVEPPIIEVVLVHRASREGSRGAE